MGNYLSRDKILQGGWRVEDVSAFGGMVRVREVPADLMQSLIEGGVIETVTGPDGKEREQIDLSKINMIQIAARCIVGEDGKPLFSAADVPALGSADFASIQAVATAAMRMLSERRQGDADPNAR